MSHRFDVPERFEWRAPTGRWRWLILGALGVTPLGCGGAADRATELQQSNAATGSGEPGGGAGPGEGGGAGFGGGGPREPGPTTTASACEAPLTDRGGGWEQCGNGMLHRASLGSCTSNVPRSGPLPFVARADAGYGGECRRDEDCTAKPFGHCEPGVDTSETYCAYGCVTNSDCEPGFACVCGEPVGACRVASCTTDADCGAGLLCSDYALNPGCGGQAFACQTASDACASARDCPGFQYCVRGGFDASTEGRPSYCSDALCAIGRPFLVGGHERLAPPVARSDWYPASAPTAGAAVAPPALRDAVHHGWLQQALMEHASVAAFARFSLQLLALGAPAELCEQAAIAMRDEIAHARACFELARRHGERDVGPGPLDLAGALDTAELQEVMLGAIAEGCVGETLAAIEAAEALAHCEDEAARPTLARIAEDETRHAELAWRFVAWALELGPESLRERARLAFTEAAQPGAATARPSQRDLELARRGLITPPLRAELRARVLRDVITPCARALLGARPAPAATAPTAAAAHASPPAG